MPNLTTVTVTNGVPTAGSGTVSTLDGLMNFSNSASAVATSATNVQAISYLYGYNGTTWDQLQVDGSKRLITSAVQNGTWNIGTLTSITNPVAVTQSGTWNIGTLTSITNPVAATQSGTWNIGTLTSITNAISANATLSAETTKVIGTVRNLGNAGANLDFAGQNATGTINSVLVGGQFNTAPTTITSGNFSPLQLDAGGLLKVNIFGNSTTTVITGDLANAATDTGSNPVKIGGVARTANPTAVSNGQRVDGSFDKVGRLLVAGVVRTLKGVQKTSITTASETTVVTAGAAGVFNDVYAITVTNKSATSVFVDFKDSTAGTTRMTLAAPAGDTRGFTVPVDSSMIQATAANNWTATVSSAVTSIEITMLYVSNI